MTKFENKETSMKQDGNKMTYADLVLACSNFVPKQFAKEGWSPKLQKESFRLEDAFSNAKPKKTLEVEDADIQLVKKFCSDFPWSRKHRDLVAFDDYIKSL